MRIPRSLARAGRAPHGPAGRRLRACPRPIVRRGDSPDRLTRELAERVPRMAGHHRAVAEMAGAVARRIGLTGERLHAVVRSSHERWDGSGYPDGLSEEDIPLGSRIITICDAYDAMTHARPYRQARPAADALAELRAGAGVRYDPCLVDVFFDIVAATPPRP